MTNKSKPIKLWSRSVGFRKSSVRGLEGGGLFSQGCQVADAPPRASERDPWRKAVQFCFFLASCIRLGKLLDHSCKTGSS